MLRRKLFISALLFCLLPIVSQAQNPILNHYKLGEGLNFSGNENYEFQIRGYVQPFLELRSYKTEEGKQFDFSPRLRRARLSFSGEAKKFKIDYRLQIDLTGSSEDGDITGTPLLDAWIGYSPNKFIKIIVGQKATLTDNRELVMNSQTLQLAERSRLTSAFSSIREFGVFVQGNVKLGKAHYLKPQFALTNGDGVNVLGPDYGGVKVGGRLDYLPFGLFTNLGQFRQADVMRELTPKLVVGASYSMNYGMSSRRGRGSGDILYFTEAMEESLPNYSKIGFDFLFKYKGFSMLGEFVSSNATSPDDIFWRQRNDGSLSSSFLVNGVQDVDAYVKGRMMMGSALNIQMGYVFKKRFSIDARYTHLNAAKNSFLNNGRFYNRPNYYTLGLSKYFGKGYGFKIQADVTYIEVGEGSNDANGNLIIGNEWMTRFITTISF
jgi:hypothetical protein